MEEKIKYDTTIAEKLVEKLLPLFSAYALQTELGKVVVAISGGSGSGKSVMALLISEFLKEKGIGSYILAGDNYPHRIPKYNDLERLQIFRESAIIGMVKEETFTQERFDNIQKYQEKECDADAKYIEEYPWYESYIRNGRKGLEDYLGTEKEINFEEINRLVYDFKVGKPELWVRCMGREETQLWYEKKDFREIKVLIVEGTHSNSNYCKGVDISIYLDSTPQETLKRRRERNRDEWIDHPFTMLVLDIEQQMLRKQSAGAKLIVTREGTVLEREEYDKFIERKEDTL